jgi:hypothetical protein
MNSKTHDKKVGYNNNIRTDDSYYFPWNRYVEGCVVDCKGYREVISLIMCRTLEDFVQEISNA